MFGEPGWHTGKVRLHREQGRVEKEEWGDV